MEPNSFFDTPLMYGVSKKIPDNKVNCAILNSKFSTIIFLIM